jgi:hypothetical protein
MPDVLNALAAFAAGYQRCGDLDGGKDDVCVWLTCSCGARVVHPVSPPSSRADHIRSVAGRRDCAHSGGLGITLGHPLLLSEPHAKERGKVMGALKTAAGLQGRVLALFAKTWGSSGDDQEVEEEFRHEARPSTL